MAEQNKILSQHEVDALLSAIDSGEVEVGLEEMEAVQAAPYDFKRPERVARDQLRAINALHEVFTRNLHTALAGMLRTVVEVSVASVDQLTFAEFLNSLPNPTVLYVFSCEPLEGHFIMEMNPTVAFPIIERLLGSRLSGSVQPEREFTPIEWNLIGRVMDRALGLLREAWANVAELDFKVTNKASNPQLMQIMAPNEPVVMIVIEMVMGESKGYFNLCAPVLTIEPLMDRISQHSWFASRRREPSASQEQVISQSLSKAEMDVVVHFPLEQIQLSQLRGLAAGDILITNQEQTRPVILSVEGRPKFRARLGSYRDHRAVRVSTAIPEDEEFKVLTPGGGVTVARAGEADREGTRPDSGRAEADDIANLLQVPVVSSVVLAEKVISLRDVLSLKQGDIVDFNKRIDEPLTFLAGGRPIAQGVTVKIGEKFGMQISQIGGTKETLRSLGPG